MSSKHSIYLDNTSSVLLKGLKRAIDDMFINDAVVTMTLLENDGSQVAGETWPVTLDYIESSNGEYAGSFSHNIEVARGSTYDAEIIATASDGSQAKWTESVLVKARSE